MKKTILFTLLLFTTLISTAQRNDKFKRIKAKKIAFITERLDLTENEAEKFWPLYNKFEKEKHKLFKQEKETIKNKINAAGGVEKISEQEAKKCLDLFHKIKSSLEAKKTAFHNDLLEFLSAKKVLQLEVLEHRFNKSMLKRFKERRGRRMN